MITRRRIIDAAREAISSRGLAGLSMDRVAAGSGYSRRTVYNHFVDRSDLYREAMLDLLGRVESASDIGLGAEMSIVTAVRKFCGLTVAIMRSPEYAEVRAAIDRDGAAAHWLSIALDRRVLRPMERSIETYLAGRLELPLPAAQRATFCSSMMATLEAAAGAGGSESSSCPFTVDEVADVILARLGGRSFASSAPGSAGKQSHH